MSAMRRAGRAERPHPTPLATTVALGILVLYAAMTAGAGFLLVAEHSNALFLAAVPIVFATYPAVGALIILRQGSHAVGWILEAIGVVVLVMISSGDYALYALVDHPGSLPFGEVFAVAS